VRVIVSTGRAEGLKSVREKSDLGNEVIQKGQQLKAVSTIGQYSAA
jgi:hypothetical protein